MVDFAHAAPAAQVAHRDRRLLHGLVARRSWSCRRPPPLVVIVVVLAALFGSAARSSGRPSVCSSPGHPAERPDAGRRRPRPGRGPVVRSSSCRSSRIIVEPVQHAGRSVFAVPFLLVGAIVVMAAAGLLRGRHAQRLRSALAARRVAASQAAGRSKLLVCRDVDVEYDGVQVLFGVDFDVEEGEIIALLGTNGAGKSTLLRAISGTQEASSGAIVFDGRDITHMPPHEIAARGVIHMPGGRGVFPGLASRENLMLGNWLTEDATDAEQRARRGVRDLPGPGRAGRRRRPSTLSGGEQQMLSLAQAFLAKPRLLMIDELSLGLSPARRRPAARDRHARSTAAGVDDHRRRAVGQRRAHLAERAIFMEKGEVRFVGRDRGAAAPSRHPPGRLREGHRRAHRAGPRVGAALERDAPRAARGGPPDPRGRGSHEALRRRDRGRRRLSFAVPRRPGARPHRPERLGQDDAVRHHQRLPDGRRRHGARSTASTSPSWVAEERAKRSSSAASRTRGCSRRSRCSRRCSSRSSSGSRCKSTLLSAVQLPERPPRRAAAAAPGRPAHRAARARRVPRQVRQGAVDRSAPHRRPRVRAGHRAEGAAARRAVVRHRPGRGRGPRRRCCGGCGSRPAAPS